MEKEEKLIVAKIKDGTVIDHIKAGKGKKVLDFLGINENYPEITTLLMNVPSKSIGKKDIVKVANKTLKEEEVNKIALIAPNATYNVIKNYEVKEKRKLQLPNIVQDTLKCPNPNCVTNSGEPVIAKFIVEKGEPTRLRCYHCERLIDIKDVL
jgi:aspartate carbamoyltransferase regulatory subunit